ncbi:MAG: hypothetical protein ACQET6_06885 [Bacillota bacterium]
MKLNKKSFLVIASIIVGIVILFLVYDVVNQSPKEVVTNIMEDIQENKKVEEISKEDQEKLQPFFVYSQEKNLEKPNLIISDYPGRPDIVKVTFEIIHNNKKTGIEAIYEGQADFYLKKQGLHWEVEGIQVTPYRKEW